MYGSRFYWAVEEEYNWNDARNWYSLFDGFVIILFLEYYNPLFYNITDHGTLHVSTVDSNRQMVSVTSTVNLFFGSKIKGKRTGIVFNDEMDDFSSPEFENDFDVPPSEINFIEPEKRMVSSMGK